MMRNFKLLAAALLIAAGCGRAVQEDIVLDFNVSEPVSGEVVLVVHDKISTVSLDQDGKARIVLEGYEAAYARLFYGREFKWIYIEGGDHAAVSFNGNDFDSSFAYDGEKGEAVNYLNTITLTALPDEDYALPFDEYLAKVRKKEQEAVKLMKANGLGKAGNFETLEEGRIRYSYATLLLMHPIGHMMMTGQPGYEPDEFYYDTIDSYLDAGPLYAVLDEFRSFAAEAAHVLDEGNRNVSALYPKTLAQMRFISDRFSDEETRNTLLHYLAAAYVDSYGTDDITDMENIYRTYVKDEAMLAEFEAKCDRWDRSTPGKPSPALSGVDVDGKTWTLDDFKGKYVYIDMWATWCAPCRREMPFLKELHKQFEDAAIVFLGLSTDGDRDKWKEMVQSGDLTGVQLYLGPQSGFQKAYNIEAIPRFILLDRNGVIISNDMTRPSDPATAETLNALEGIR